APFERTGADLRSAEILQHGDHAPGALRGRANPLERGGVAVVRAVREVQSKDVGAGGDERVDHRVAVARGTDGGDDLRMTSGRLLVAGSLETSDYNWIMGQIVPDAVERYLASLNRAGDAVVDDIARAGAARELPLVG